MPKQKLIRSSDFPYHISARSNNREWFGLHPDLLWTIFEDYLYLTQKLFNLEIHTFVLMSNHFHLLAKTPDVNLDEAMLYFLRETSRVIGFELGRINHIYGGPYHSSLIDDYSYYLNAYKYILRNPIKAKMCQRVEDYKYSTLHGLLGKSPLLIPTLGNEELFYNTDNFLRWLNESMSDEKQEVIRKALKKRYFEPFVCRRTGRMTDFKGGLPKRPREDLWDGALLLQKEGRT